MSGVISAKEAAKIAKQALEKVAADAVQAKRDAEAKKRRWRALKNALIRAASKGESCRIVQNDFALSQTRELELLGFCVTKFALNLALEQRLFAKIETARSLLREKYRALGDHHGFLEIVFAGAGYDAISLHAFLEDYWRRGLLQDPSNKEELYEIWEDLFLEKREVLHAARSHLSEILVSFQQYKTFDKNCLRIKHKNLLAPKNGKACAQISWATIAPIKDWTGIEEVCRATCLKWISSKNGQLFLADVFSIIQQHASDGLYKLILRLPTETTGWTDPDTSAENCPPATVVKKILESDGYKVIELEDEDEDGDADSTKLEIRWA